MFFKPSLKVRFEEKVEIDRKKYPIPKEQRKAVERLEKTRRKILPFE